MEEGPRRDKGKGKAKATDKPEANVLSSPSDQAEDASAEKRLPSLKKKVSLARLTRRSTPAPEEPTSSRVFEGGFYVRRAPKTPSAESSTSKANESAGPVTPVIPPTNRQNRALSAESLPQASDTSMVSRQASNPPGILRERRPAPITVLTHTTKSSVFPRGLPYDDEASGERQPVSPDPFYERTQVRQPYEVTVKSPLRHAMTAEYDESPSEQSSLRAARLRSDTETSELRYTRSRGGFRGFFGSRNPEKKTPSPRGLNSSKQQGEASSSSVIQNIGPSSSQDAEKLSPESATMKGPLFSGNSFRSLYKRSPSSTENLLSASNKLPAKATRETSDTVRMDTKANQKTMPAANTKDKADQDDDSSSSSSSDMLTSLEPIAENPICSVPGTGPARRELQNLYGSSLRHPVTGDNLNAMNYTDREYGRHYLGYTWLKDDEPSGLDSLLAIGGYGRKLRTFALNASNERFRPFQYYKPYEVEQWAEQQGSLTWYTPEDLPAKILHDENFEKVRGFEEPLCKTVRSLPDLRSAWEISKPFDAAAHYNLPASSHPLKKFVYPEGALSFEPHDRYAGLAEKEFITDVLGETGLAGAGSNTSHIQDLDTFELAVDLSNMAIQQQGSEGKEVVEDASHHVVEPSSDWIFEDSDEEDMTSGHQEPSQSHEVPERDIVQRLNDLDYLFEDSDEEDVTSGHQEQQEPSQPYDVPERDIVQRLNDLDHLFEDSDEEDVTSNQQQRQGPGTQEMDLEAEVAAANRRVQRRFTAESRTSQTGLIPLLLAPTAHLPRARTSSRADNDLSAEGQRSLTSTSAPANNETDARSLMRTP